MEIIWHKGVAHWNVVSATPLGGKKVIHFFLPKRSEGAPVININFQSIRTWFNKFNEEK